MIVAQENVAWCRSSDPAYLKLLFQNIPELRYTLDIKQAHRAGHSWREYFEVVAPAPRQCAPSMTLMKCTCACCLGRESLITGALGSLRDVGYNNRH